jgi:D-glycero-D-manno-heptose 1,7-bisphosphate phosphatase
MNRLRRAVFVDRDGTLIVERSYLSDPAGVHLVPGSTEALAALRAAGFGLVLVTNQSGIALGHYTEDDYRAVAARLDALLAAAGVQFDAVYYCVHHPDVSGPCECRKPGTGMHRRAARALGLDLARSFYLGDKVTDVLPTLELGGQGVLVRTGYGREQEARVPPGTWIAEDLQGAARRILEEARLTPVFRPG